MPFDPNLPFEIEPEGAPESAPPFDPSKPFEFAEPSSALRRYVADPAISLSRGIIALPEAAVGVADIPTFGATGKLLEAGGYGFQPKVAKEFLSDLYSPEAKLAQERVARAKGFFGTAGAMIENPSTIAETVIESAPSMLGGAGIARGAVGALPKVFAGVRGAIAAGALGEGAITAGQIAEQMREESESGFLTPKQSALSLTAGLATGLIGALGGRLANKLGITDVDTLLAGGGAAANAAKKNIFRRIAESAISEGLLEELPQSAQERLQSNLAAGKPALEGVAEDAASGFLAGFVMGGAGGIPGGARPRPKAPAFFQTGRDLQLGPRGEDDFLKEEPAWRKWTAEARETVADELQKPFAERQPISGTTARLSGRVDDVEAAYAYQPTQDRYTPIRIEVRRETQTPKTPVRTPPQVAEIQKTSSLPPVQPISTQPNAAEEVVAGVAPAESRGGVAPPVPIPTPMEDAARYWQIDDAVRAETNPEKAVELFQATFAEREAIKNRNQGFLPERPSTSTAKPSETVTAAEAQTPADTSAPQTPPPPEFQGPPNYASYRQLRNAESHEARFDAINSLNGRLMFIPDIGTVKIVRNGDRIEIQATKSQGLTHAPGDVLGIIGRDIAKMESGPAIQSMRLAKLIADSGDLHSKGFEPKEPNETAPTSQQQGASPGAPIEPPTPAAPTGEKAGGQVQREVTSHASAPAVQGEGKQLEPQATTAFDPSRLPTVEVPVSDIRLSKDVPNFKGEASETTGVVPGQDLAGRYERRGTAPVVLWRRLNGALEIITGRHRLDLARRNKEQTIPAQIVDEAKGFTKAMALTFDAEANIRDGQGSIKDYAHYFKLTPDLTEAEAVSRGLLSRAKGKAGWQLARFATDDLYSLWLADKLTDDQALAIVKSAPRDLALQRVGVKQALKGRNGEQIANDLNAAKVLTATTPADQMDMFGSNDAAIQQMERMSDIARARQRDLQEDIRAISGASKNPERARKLGVDVKDPAAVEAKLRELWREKYRWDDWSSDTELIRQIREQATPTKPREAKQYVYKSPMRPVLSLSAYWPKGWKMIDANTVAFDKPLTGEQVKQWELEPQDPNDPINIKKRHAEFADKIRREIQGPSEITLKDGQKLIFSDNVDPAQKNEFPFRVTRLLSDGTPAGHETYRDFDEVIQRLWLSKDDIASIKGAEALELAPPESVEEQKARLAREDEARKKKEAAAKLAEQAAKPLAGTAGDLGQGALLGAPEDLFAPPTPKPAAPAPPSAPIINAGQADALRERMRENLKRRQKPKGGAAALTEKVVKPKKSSEQVAADQQLFNDGVQLGALYIQQGAHRFQDWSARMREDFGEAIEPHLRSIYESARITIESPVSQGAEGRSPGLQPGLRPPGERIVTARAQFTKPADESIIPPETARFLDPHQRQGAAAALKALNERGGFLLADGTGAGKTRQALAVADYYAKQGRRVIIVTKAETIKPDWRKNQFGGSYAFDGGAMGIKVKLAREGAVAPGEIGITTYENLAHVERNTDKNTILIYDESHAQKNQSQRAKFAVRASAKAERVMFMSATPADKPEHIYYLAPIGVMEGKTVQQQLRDLGMTLVTTERLVKEPQGWVKRKVTYWAEDQNVTDAERHERFSALFDRLTERGMVLKREISMDGVHVQVLRLALPAEAHETMGDILSFFDANTIDDLQGLKKATVLQHQRRQQEPFKVAPAVMLAKRELEAGRQVVLFVSRVNESEVGKWVTMIGPGGEKERFRQVLMSSEGTAKTLRAALEEAGIHDIAEIHGEADQASLEAMADFQAGRKRVVIATIESGGTGINLDDTVGTRPRTMIVVTSPFDAVGNVQAAGRIWRLKTLSDASVFYLFGDTDVDAWNADIIGTKMSMLGAVVEGQVRRLNMSDPELVGTDDFHSQVSATPAAPEKAPTATGTAVPTLDWKPFKTKAGKDRFVAPATKEFWNWYNANGKGDNPLGLRPSKYQDKWQVWTDELPPGAQSLTEEAPVSGMAEADARTAVDAWRGETANAPEVEVVNRPDWTQTGADGKQYGVRGWWDGQKITVNLAYVTDAAALREVLEHERIHPILDSPQGQQAIESAIAQELGDDALAQIQKRYARGANESEEAYRRRATAEWFAQLKENEPSLWRRILARIREFLARFKIVELSDDEIGRAMLRRLEAEARATSQLRAGNATVDTQPGLVRIGGIPALTAYHGTPHKVDKFTTAKIGTGEGAQVYGWGLYFAENPEVARQYTHALAQWEFDGKRLPGYSSAEMRLNTGRPAAESEAMAAVASLRANQTVFDAESYLRDRARLLGETAQGRQAQSALEWLESNRDRFVKRGNSYTVTLNAAPDELLDWDKPLSQQSEKVKAAVRTAFQTINLPEGGEPFFKRAIGESAYASIASAGFTPPADSGWTSIANVQWRNGKIVGNEQTASLLLAKAGLKGIRYLDQGSRNAPDLRVVESTSGQFRIWDAGNGGWFTGDLGTREQAERWLTDHPQSVPKRTYNYVIFNDADIQITHENGQPVTMAEAMAEQPGAAALTKEPVGPSEDLQHDDAPEGEQAQVAGIPRTGQYRPTEHMDEILKAVREKVIDSRKPLAETLERAWEIARELTDPSLAVRGGNALKYHHTIGNADAGLTTLKQEIMLIGLKQAFTGDDSLLRYTFDNSADFQTDVGGSATGVGRKLRAEQGEFYGALYKALRDILGDQRLDNAAIAAGLDKETLFDLIGKLKDAKLSPEEITAILESGQNATGDTLEDLVQKPLLEALSNIAQQWLTKEGRILTLTGELPAEVNLRKRIEAMFPKANYRKFYTEKGADGFVRDFFQLLVGGEREQEGHIWTADKLLGAELRRLFRQKAKELGFDPTATPKQSLYEKIAQVLGKGQLRREKIAHIDGLIRAEIEKVREEAGESEAAQEAAATKAEMLESAWDEIIGTLSDSPASKVMLNRVLADQFKKSGKKWRDALTDPALRATAIDGALSDIQAASSQGAVSRGFPALDLTAMRQALELRYDEQLAVQRAKQEASQRLAQERAAKSAAGLPERTAKRWVDEFERLDTEWIKPEKKNLVLQIIRDFLNSNPTIHDYPTAEDIAPLRAEFVKVGVTEASAENLARAVHDKARREWADANARSMERAAESGNVRSLVESILADPYRAQNSPEWVHKTAVDWFKSNGLTPERAEAAYKLFEPQFRKALADAQEKIATQVLESNRKDPRTIKELVTLIRSGVLDPKRNWLDALAERRGWKKPTPEQYGKLEELDAQLARPELSPLERRDIVEQQHRIIRHLGKLDGQAARTVAESFMASLLTGIRTFTVQFTGAVAAARDLLLQSSFDPKNALNFARALKNAAVNNAKSQLAYTWQKGISAFHIEELEQNFSQLERLHEDVMQVFKTGTPVQKAVAAGKWLFAQQRFVLRLLNAMDSASAAVIREYKLAYYSSIALKEAGLDGRMLSELLDSQQEFRQAEYEKWINAGLDHNRAHLRANATVDATTREFLARKGVGDRLIDAVFQSAENDAYGYVGRKSPGVTETGPNSEGLLSVPMNEVIEFVGKQKAKGGLSAIGAQTLFGFVAIPWRATRFASTFSWYGLVRAGIDAYRTKRGLPTFWKQSYANSLQSRARLREAIAGTVVGMAAGLLFASSADDDSDDDTFKAFVTGSGPSNKNLRDAWIKRGFQPYALNFKIAGRIVSIPLTRVGEFIMYPFIIAAAIDDARWKQKERALTGNPPHNPVSLYAGELFGEHLAMMGQRGLLQTAGRLYEMSRQPGSFGKGLASLVAGTASGIALPFKQLLQSLSDMFVGPLDNSSATAIVANSFPIVGLPFQHPSVNRFGDAMYDRSWYGRIARTGVPIAFQVDKTPENMRMYPMLVDKGAAAPELRRGNLENKYGPLTDDQFSDFARKSGAVLKQSVTSNLDKLEKATPEKVKEFLQNAAQQADRTAAAALGLKQLPKAQPQADESAASGQAPIAAPTAVAASRTTFRASPIASRGGLRAALTRPALRPSRLATGSVRSRIGRSRVPKLSRGRVRLGIGRTRRYGRFRARSLRPRRLRLRYA